MSQPNIQTPDVPGLKCINQDRRLFVIPAGGGYSCLGFDVAKRQTDAVAAWLKRPDLAAPAEVGTVEAWRAYQAAMEAGRAHNAATGERCAMDLTPALIGLEGRRVKVTTPDGEESRFWVGKSSGWSPCHLEISRRNSSGGPAVYVPQGLRVEVIGEASR